MLRTFIGDDMPSLPNNFPFKHVFQEFLREYRGCRSYWYVPKVRSLNDDNVKVIQKIVRILSERFVDRVWDTDSQDKLLTTLVKKGILEPYKPDGTQTDRTALSRIWKKLLETLGLAWVHEDKLLVITDAGYQLVNTKDARPVIEQQIAKIQYPVPSLSASYKDSFNGLLPHLFLLQVLQRCDYHLSLDEYMLFVNLAQKQTDLPRVVSYIEHWRDLTTDECIMLTDILEQIPMSGDSSFTRRDRIRHSSPYQISFYTYPHCLKLDDSTISCTSPKEIDDLVKRRLSKYKITLFDSLEDWISYFGDPEQQPSWFTYLSHLIDKAGKKSDVTTLIKSHKQHLTSEEIKEIEIKEIEKGIEDFYVKRLPMLESGLSLVKNGRQYVTPIGRMDFLCKSSSGEYVVVEIKAGEAQDSVFGQILRYMGWIHRNFKDGTNNVRGIILALSFPDTARYSRIGLIKSNYQTFIKFKRHGLNVSDS